MSLISLGNMGWIAKNSITGKTYGLEYDCIWDCQGFIDSHLKLLEYEFQRAFALEKEFLNDIEHVKKKKGHSIVEDVFLRIQMSLHDFENEFFPKEKMEIITHKCFSKGKEKREFDEQLMRYVKTHWLSNNIIRCWHVGQKRFADGFDF